MDPLPELTRVGRLEIDLDLRLRSLWDIVWGEDVELTLAVVAAALRAAYGQGYLDACLEPIRGELLREYGYMRPLELPTGAAYTERRLRQPGLTPGRDVD